jgi:hypothetical protein
MAEGTGKKNYTGEKIDNAIRQLYKIVVESNEIIENECFWVSILEMLKAEGYLKNE